MTRAVEAWWSGSAGAKPVLILASAFLILAGSAVLFGLPQVRRAAQIGAAGRARMQMAAWVRVVEAYTQAHGSLPGGDGQGALEWVLRDASVREVLAEESPGAPGPQLLDPWGTAWRIQAGPRIEVRSAGPNRRFGDGDDLSSLQFQGR